MKRFVTGLWCTALILGFLMGCSPKASFKLISEREFNYFTYNDYIEKYKNDEAAETYVNLAKEKVIEQYDKGINESYPEISSALTERSMLYIIKDSNKKIKFFESIINHDSFPDKNVFVVKTAIDYKQKLIQAIKKYAKEIRSREQSREQNELNKKLALAVQKQKEIEERDLQIDFDRKRVVTLQSGKQEVESIKDAELLHRPSDKIDLIMHTPLEPKDELNRYFVWRCPLKKKLGELYVCWDGKASKGYALTKIIKKFDSIRIDTEYWVVGKYAGNTEIVLVSGESKTIPVLTDVYIQAKQ